jgi:hypothetical protein
MVSDRPAGLRDQQAAPAGNGPASPGSEQVIQLGEDLLGRDRLDRAAAKLLNAALDLSRPGPLDLGFLIKAGN